MSFGLLLIFALALQAASNPGWAATDTTRTEVQTEVLPPKVASDETQETVAADSSSAVSAIDRELRLQVWRTWKDISAAVAIDSLDGPSEVTEKAEIIEDRIDALGEHRDRLAELTLKWRKREKSLALQLEVLDDLAELRLGGDLGLLQRIESAKEDLDATRLVIPRIVAGTTALEVERASHLNQLERYRELIVGLREEEEKRP